jgi:hypothetical protein
MRSGSEEIVRIAGVIALASLCAAGCGGRIQPTVTCDSLRQIKLGMDAATVEQVLGRPFSTTGRYAPLRNDPRQVDEVWQYGSDNYDAFYLFSHTDRMYAELRQGRLIKIAAYRKLSDYPPQPRLFDLRYEKAADGTEKEVREEPELFVDAFCPGTRRND